MLSAWYLNSKILEIVEHNSRTCCFVLLGEWVHWQNKVEEYIYPPDKVPEFASILVPNVDNVRTEFLIKIISKQNKVIGCLIKF